jgi:hypothetical protein
VHVESLSVRQSMPHFPKSSLRKILTDRAYMGEIEFRRNW